jgi:Domain of unknown function (DUF4491)
MIGLLINLNAFSGIIIELVSFLIIEIFHPIVIKSEYHFGTKIWPAFLAGAIICIIFSLLSDNIIICGGLGVAAFSFCWSIIELFQQKKRVEKGWFSNKKDQ